MGFVDSLLLEHDFTGNPGAHFSGSCSNISTPRPKGLFLPTAYGLATAMSSFPEHLLEGYRAFTSQRLPTEQSRYRELSDLGQSPEEMVIGCFDSRGSPEVVFGAGPSVLFGPRSKPKRGPL